MGATDREKQTLQHSSIVTSLMTTPGYNCVYKERFLYSIITGELKMLSLHEYEAEERMGESKQAGNNLNQARAVST